MFLEFDFSNGALLPTDLLVGCICYCESRCVWALIICLQKILKCLALSLYIDIFQIIQNVTLNSRNFALLTSMTIDKTKFLGPTQKYLNWVPNDVPINCFAFVCVVDVMWMCVNQTNRHNYTVKMSSPELNSAENFSSNHLFKYSTMFVVNYFQFVIVWKFCFVFLL